MIVKLYLEIDGRFYVLQTVPLTPGAAASAAWNLQKVNGTVYTLHKDRHGTHCTCGDFTFRRGNSPQGCKHIEALKEAGLL